MHKRIYGAVAVAIGSAGSVAALAAWRPAPVVRPSAIAMVEAAVIAAAFPPRDVAAAAPGGVTRTSVEVRTRTRLRQVLPLFRPVPGPLRYGDWGSAVPARRDYDTRWIRLFDMHGTV